MKKIIQLFILGFIINLVACKKDSEFLDEPPTSILTNDQAFKDPAQVLSILADLYNRQVDISTLKSWTSMADFSETFPSENGQSAIVQRNSWGFGEWSSWDYNYIRDLNLFIERATAATTLSENDRTRFVSEARFLRANYYFELVKRMGGVPIITKSLLYDFSGDPTYLQTARSKESEVYDFVLKEGEEIKDLLPANLSDKSRASKGAVLAMQARAALYAGSIARYGATTPQVSLPGGEVSIPVDAAVGYYTKALAAAQAIISGSAGAYALYKSKPDLAENFASIFIDKGNNPESIFIED
ncbi:MAG: RagB/SusD family nutrient uptake outer membrane protein, partial [Pedobacter sp.]